MVNLSETQLRRWRRDVVRDIEELHATLEWLDAELGLLDEPEPAPAPEAPEPPQEAIPEADEAPGQEARDEPTEAVPSPPAKRAYVRADPAAIRDAVRTLGRASAGEVAEQLGSKSLTSQLNYKLDKLYEQGTLVRIKVGRRKFYEIAKPAHPELRAKKPQSAKLRLVGSDPAVPRTGRRNYKVLKRKGAIKGVKGT